MRCARSPKALSRCHIYAAAFICNSAFAQQTLFHHIHASKFTLYLCSCIYAAAFTQPHLSCRANIAAFFRSSHAAALVPPLSRCHIYAAAFTLQHARSPHLCRRSHATAFMPQHLCCRIHVQHSFAALTPQHWCSCSYAAAFIRHLARHRIFCSRIHAATLTPPHSRCSIYASGRAPLHLRCSSRAGALQIKADHSVRIF